MAFKESEERRARERHRRLPIAHRGRAGRRIRVLALTRDYDTIQTSFKDLLAKSEAARMAENLENRQTASSSACSTRREYRSGRSARSAC